MKYPNYEHDAQDGTISDYRDEAYPINFSGTGRLQINHPPLQFLPRNPTDHRIAAVESIDDQIARLEERRARALEKLRLRSLFGDDVYHDGFVLFFQKKYPHSATVYSYAAVKAGGYWWTTGSKNKGGVTWDQLLDFIIDQGQTLNLKFASKWENFPIVPEKTDTDHLGPNLDNNNDTDQAKAAQEE